jgi:chromosome segregation ATPase
MATRSLLWWGAPKASGRSAAKPIVMLAPEPARADDLLEGGRDEAVSPLQTLANAIQKAAADLRQLDAIRLDLEALRAPVAEEFENRVVDNNRLAQLTSELRTTRERLAEAEAALHKSQERSRDLEARAAILGGDLERTRVSLAAANEALERLRPEHQEALGQIEEQRAHMIAYSSDVFDLKTDKEYLSRQLEVSEAERAAAEAQLAGAREAAAEAQARGDGALKRLEQAAAENAALDKTVSELKVTTAGEHDRANELASQLAAARAEARLAAEAMNQALETSRAETDDLRARLEESVACARHMQELHAELAAGQGAHLEDKARLQRDLAAALAENRQSVQRIEVLDNLAADNRRRLTETESARQEAAGRGEALQLELTQTDTALKRAEAIAEQKGNELQDAFRTHEDEQTRLRAEIDALKSDLSQTRAELKMTRASLASKS